MLPRPSGGLIVAGIRPAAAQMRDDRCDLRIFFCSKAKHSSVSMLCFAAERIMVVSR